MGEINAARRAAGLLDPLDLAGVAVVPVGGVAVLQVDRWVSPKEAAQIRSTWRAVTGGDCVLLAGELRLGGVVVGDVGTPIFDQLLEERRAPGAFVHPLTVAEVIAPAPRVPVAARRGR